MKSKIFLSIIIPLYNEEKRIGNIPFIFDYLKKQKFSSEVIIVNDGSSDKTLKKLKNMKLKMKHQIISYPTNKGKGYAIKTGMLKAKGKYRLFIDVDLSTPIDEFDQFSKHIEKYDIVIGSRKLKNSKLLIRQPWIREHLGKVFTKLSQNVLQLPLSDFTCGFKCFSDKAANEIFSKQQLERWGFDSEVLFIGHRKGFLIKEVPVTWQNSAGTKVRFPQDIITSLSELLRIRMNYIKKIYD